MNEKSDVRPSSRDSGQICQDTALHGAALKGNVAAINDLIKEGANVNQLSECYHNNPYNSRTPLHYAVLKNNIEAINALIAAGADVNKLSMGQTAPLHYAVKNGNIAAINALIKAGADIYLSDHEPEMMYTSLDYARRTKNVDIIQAVIANIKMDEYYQDRRTLLHDSY